jgi:hypothetical protein
MLAQAKVVTLHFSIAYPDLSGALEQTNPFNYCICFRTDFAVPRFKVSLNGSNPSCKDWRHGSAYFHRTSDVSLGWVEGCNYGSTCSSRAMNLRRCPPPPEVLYLCPLTCSAFSGQSSPPQLGCSRNPGFRPCEMLQAFLTL